MNKPELGRIEKVKLREVWKDEAAEFTPWLAETENITLLGEAIGIELELVSTEEYVGSFKADIICKDTIDNHYVLIENQLETTDHNHLGQILTYAAGLEDVSAIVWITSRFRDEHRAALDWLNEIANGKVNFFGIEIELWRIGNSSPAPKFNMVCMPNTWKENVVPQRGILSETQQLQLEYWQAYKEYLSNNSKIKCTKPYPQNWVTHSIGRSGFFFTSVASTWDSVNKSSTGENRVELYFNNQESKKYFSIIEKEKEKIEKEIGEPLFWYNPEGKKQAKIYARKPADISNRSLWTEQFAWLKENLDKFYRVFAPRIKNLNMEESNGDA